MENSVTEAGTGEGVSDEGCCICKGLGVGMRQTSVYPGGGRGALTALGGEASGRGKTEQGLAGELGFYP